MKSLTLDDTMKVCLYATDFYLILSALEVTIVW